MPENMARFFCFLVGLTWLLEGCEQAQLQSTPRSSLPRIASASRTLDFGISPWTSAGLLGSAICHDSVLYKELATLGWGLECTALANGNEVRKGIEEGWLDAGTLDEYSASIACSTGIAVILSLADQSYKALISRTPTLIHQLSDATIGYPTNPSAPGYLRNYLSKLHFNMQKLQLEPYHPFQLSDLLQRQKIDAILSWEPISSLIMEQNPEWQYIVRTTGSIYLLAHDLLRNDHAVVLAVLRSQIRQLQQLQHLDYRLKTESHRWEFASSLGFPGVSPRSIQMLAENPTPLSFCPSQYVAHPTQQIPSSCIDTTLYHQALHEVSGEAYP